MVKNRTLEWLLLLTVFVWGINTPIMKVGLLYIPPMLYNTIRLLIAAALAWPILWYSKTYKPIQKVDIIPMLAVSLGGFFFSQVLLAAGLPKTTAGNASLMIALLPINVVIINRIFKKETIRVAVAIGSVISLLGAICIVLGSGKAVKVESSHLIGSLLILIAQIGNAYYTVFSKDLLDKYSSYQITTYVLTLSAVAFSILAMPELLALQWSEIPIRAWTSIGYSALFALLFGNIIWVWVIGKLGSTSAAFYQNLVPVFSIIGAFFLLGEVMSWLQLVGTGVVFLGLYVTRMKVTKKMVLSFVKSDS